MRNYAYKAIDSRKNEVKGTMRAKNVGTVKSRLRSRRLKPVNVVIEGEDVDGSGDEWFGGMIFKDDKGAIQISLGNQKPTTKHLIVFTKQLATMVNSGVSLIQALNILANQQPSRIFKKALLKVRFLVENGSTLSEALATFPNIFDELYVAMVRAGEASGKLDTILLQLVTYIEKADKIKSQAKSAMWYPSIVLVVAVVVVVGLLIFVVPTFAEQYSESGKELPYLTQTVIDISNFFATEYLTLIVGAVVAGFLFKLWIGTPKGRKVFDRFLLRAPAFGDLFKKIAIGRFCSTMASMMSSGVNLLEALNICGASAGNKTIEEFIHEVRKSLEQGAKLSEPMAEGDLFPDMVISMISVGEATGKLDEMLEKVSAFYEEEVDLAVQTLLSLIEPVMIVGIGSIVGFIVIAMYMPVFEMAGNVG